MNFLFVGCMPRLMTNESNLVDETGLVGTDETFVDLFAVVVINHVLLEVRLVAENLPAECARDFTDNVSVAKMIFEH